jgi:Tol biopolymer transport system component
MTRSTATPASIPVRATVETPPGVTLASGGVLSPDGHYIAFTGLEAGHSETTLWLRNVETGEMRALPGTDGAARQFWSPDSRTIGFSAESRIKRIGVDGQAVRALVPTVSTRPAGATWGPDGRILYSDSGALFLVSANGGDATRVRGPDPANEEITLTWPHFLPDGRRFLYLVNSANADRAGTYIGALDTPERTRILPDAGQPVVYVPRSPRTLDEGYLLFIRERALMAQPFDASGARLTGDATTVTGNVRPNESVSAAVNGLLTFGGGPATQRLVWYDRAGTRLGVVNAPVPLRDLTLSPDERQLLANNVDPQTIGAYLIDLDRGVASRIAPGARMPYWSPDGRLIAFTHELTPGVRGLYTRPAMGRAEDTLILKTDETKFMNDWSPDGRYLVFVSWNQRTRQDLWVFPREGGEPLPYLRTEANEVQGQVSPDGRWLAYASDESGRLEVYVQSFPMPGVKFTISSNGGAQPDWRGDGRELFYLAADDTLTAVDVTPGEVPRFGPPRPLFRTTVLGSLLDARNHFTATRDGQRFLIASVDDAGRNEPIAMLVNWTARLSR